MCDKMQLVLTTFSGVSLKVHFIIFYNNCLCTHKLLTKGIFDFQMKFQDEPKT